MDEAFRMNPAQSMQKNGELPRAITDGRQVGIESFFQQAPNQGAFGRDTLMPLAVNTQCDKVLVPILGCGELGGRALLK